MSEIGIGRRSFLRAFGAAIVALPLGLTPAVLCSEPFYVNLALGFGFKVPLTWKVITAAEMGQVDMLASINPDVRKRISILLDDSTKPIVALSNDQNSSWSIQVYLASHPAEVGPIEPLIDIFHMQMFGDHPRRATKRFSLPMMKIRHDWQNARYLLSNFRVSELPRESNISNCPSAEYTASFDLLPNNAVTQKRIRVRSIAVLHHEFTYLIRLTDTTDCPAGFDSVLDTIRLI